MLSPDLTPIVIALLAALSMGGVAYVFIYPLLSGERQREKRLTAARSPAQAKHDFKKEAVAKDRTKKIQENLAQIEEQNKARKKISLQTRLKRAGLELKVAHFIGLSVVAAIFGFLFGLLMGGGLIGGAACMVIFGLGLPRWVLGHLAARRLNKFMKDFPNAIDVIVRSIKTGLPFADAIMIVAREAEEPMRSEFKELVDSQTVGMQIGEAAQRMYERIPLSEVNFFAITVYIQSQSGGNLAEALSNLSKVLREREKMRGKIQAVSQEAKTSAMIIGALPFMVAGALYLVSPGYLDPLFEETLGNLMLAGCAVWMGMGVLVMRNMINFDF